MSRYGPFTPVFDAKKRRGTVNVGTAIGEPLPVHGTATPGAIAVAVSLPSPQIFTSSTVNGSTRRVVIWVPELDLFVAGGGFISNQVSTSPDGVTWTSRTSGNNIFGLAWSPELSLMVGVAPNDTGVATDKIYTSPTGVTWTARTAPNSDIVLHDVAWSSSLGLFCAIGSSGVLPATTANTLTSPDGINWTMQANSVTYGDGICWSPDLGLFVTVRNSSTGSTSPDGVNWTTRTVGGGGGRRVTWSPDLGLLCSVGPGGADCRTSPDGVTWTGRSMPASGATAWRDVEWSSEEGMFMAVGHAGLTPMATSPDGITWTGYNLGGNNWESVAWSPALGRWIVVSSNGSFPIARIPG